jgi:hypothetical protein
VALAFAALSIHAVRAAAPPISIHIDTEAAQKTVDAVTNANLTRTQALLIADLPGNQALIAQARDFGIPSTRDSFADALIAAAQGRDVWTIFNFKEVRSNAAPAKEALNALKSDPTTMAPWITHRITPFVPPQAPLEGTGYIVAGGPGGGFSLNGGIYVNISRAQGDLGVIRVDLAHEIYHSVQHAAQARAGTLADFDYDEEVYSQLQPGVARQCYVTRELFGKLMEEGTASYVGDIALYPTSGEEALSVRKQRAASLSGHVETSISLLEIGLAAITSDDPVSEKSVYAIGFLDAGQLYYDLGYVMAKAIALRDGDAAIGRLIAVPGDAFARRYIQLSEEAGSTLPKLGPHAKRWAMRASCPAPSSPERSNAPDRPGE